MKRKVIKLASSTLVVSLPSKWAKRHGIEKGDELHIDEKKGKLSYSTRKTLESSKIKIDVSYLNSSLIWHYLTSAYIRGTDEIELYFDNVETTNPRTKQKQGTLEAISHITSDMIGLEMIRHGKNHCIIKEISKIKPEEYANILRKIFLILKNMSEELTLAIKNKEFTGLKNIKLAEKNINRFSNYCLRILNKTTDSTSIKIATNSRIIHQLEEIGDSYALLSEELSQNTKQDAKTLELIKKVNTLFSLFYETYYTTSKEKINKVYLLRDQIKKDMSKIKTKGNTMHCLKNIHEKIMDALNAKILTDL